MRLPFSQAVSRTSTRRGVRRGFFGSLKTRLRWSYALVSVIPLMALGVSLIAASLRSQRESIAQQQQTTANWVAREIRVSLSAVDEQLLKLGPQVAPNRSREDVQAAVNMLTTTLPEIIDIAVVDASGKERIHVSQLRGFFNSELIDRSDDPLVRWTLETGRVAQGPISRPDETGILSYPSYAPILSEGGVVIGAIRVEVRSDRVARTLREAPLSRGSTAYLVNNTGTLLLAGDSGAVSAAPTALAPLLTGQASNEEYQNAAGAAVIGAWSSVPIQPAPWWVVVEIPRSVAYASVQQNALWLLGAVAIVVLTTMSWGLYQARHILRPINELRAGAVTLGGGDFAARIPIHSRDEIGELAAEFNRMAEHLHTSQLEIEQQNERLREGLALARDIQIGLLPSAPPSDIPHLAIQAYSVPAYEVGGDFYTYIALDDNCMAVAVGDISGKGVGAALMMALAASSVEAQGRDVTQPKEVLATLNQQLSARLTANNMNAALLYAIIDVDHSVVSVANAGMISPFLLRDGLVQMIEAYGLPLGAMPEARYTDVVTEIQPGDLLVLVSDGIVEAHAPDGELFGFERLEATLRMHNPALRPEDLIATIIEQITVFMGGAEQHDDMTIVVVQPNLALVGDGHTSLPMEEAVA